MSEKCVTITLYTPAFQVQGDPSHLSECKLLKPCECDAHLVIFCNVATSGDESQRENENPEIKKLLRGLPDDWFYRHFVGSEKQNTQTLILDLNCVHDRDIRILILGTKAK